MTRRFYVTRSGRSYFVKENNVVLAYDRPSSRWITTSWNEKDLQRAYPGRLNEVSSPDEFIFYAREAYYAQQHP